MVFDMCFLKLEIIKCLRALQVSITEWKMKLKSQRKYMFFAVYLNCFIYLFNSNYASSFNSNYQNILW